MPSQTDTEPHLLALDMGEKRVGVATASMDTLLAKPLITLANDSHLSNKLKNLIKEHNVSTVIVGLPRNLSGQDSQQTTTVRQDIEKLNKDLGVRFITQDEALSSVIAEEELTARGKIFARADIDKLAACLILEDYIADLRS